MVDLGPQLGEKPVLVVSNNQRNAALSDVLVARITSTPRPALPTIVTLEAGDTPDGSVLCDDIFPAYRDELWRHLGALQPGTMRRVDQALRIALGIRG